MRSSTSVHDVSGGAPHILCWLPAEGEQMVLTQRQHYGVCQAAGRPVRAPTYSSLRLQRVVDGRLRKFAEIQFSADNLPILTADYDPDRSMLYFVVLAPDDNCELQNRHGCARWDATTLELVDLTWFASGTLGMNRFGGGLYSWAGRGLLERTSPTDATVIPVPLEIYEARRMRAGLYVLLGSEFVSRLGNPLQPGRMPYVPMHAFVHRVREGVLERAFLEGRPVPAKAALWLEDAGLLLTTGNTTYEFAYTDWPVRVLTGVHWDVMSLPDAPLVVRNPEEGINWQQTYDAFFALPLLELPVEQQPLRVAYETALANNGGPDCAQCVRGQLQSRYLEKLWHLVTGTPEEEAPPSWQQTASRFLLPDFAPPPELRALHKEYLDTVQAAGGMDCKSCELDTIQQRFISRVRDTLIP